MQTYTYVSKGIFKLMEKPKPVLVLSLIHIQMCIRDRDGIETARQIRKRIGKEITIIVLTSYEFSEIEEEAKAAGIDAFIAKPLFRSRLTATLRQFTSGRKEKTARNYLEKLSESDYTGKRILLVEDNELNREIAGEILQKMCIRDRTEYAALFKRFENSTNENGFGIGMPLALSILKGQGGDKMCIRDSLR